MSNRIDLVHSVTPDIALNKSPLLQRKDQLFLWSKSPTNKEKSDVRNSTVVKFSLGISFLSACGNGDIEDAKALLLKGADINSKNIDGITALHQACLDDNDEVLQFLLTNNANVNAQDMEGWTPLHAAAYCGYADIVERLIQHGANPDAINNNGELPIDLAEEEPVSAVLRSALEEKQIDVDKARSCEQHLMLTDISELRQQHKQGLKAADLIVFMEPITKATPLHVAAAKGYIDVMSALLECTNGVLEAKDVDGWTPLHAAAHWGQKEAVRLLCEAGANMDATNAAMQTPSDLAEPDMTSYLRQLKEKYGVKLRRSAARNILDNADRKSTVASRRSSVNRLSMDQKMLMRMNKEKSPVANMMEKLMLKNTLSHILPANECDTAESANKTSENAPRTSLNSSPSPLKSPVERLSLKMPKMEGIFEEGSPSPDASKAHSSMFNATLSQEQENAANVEGEEEKEGKAESSKARTSDPRVSLRSFVSIESEEPSMIIHEDEPSEVVTGSGELSPAPEEAEEEDEEKEKEEDGEPVRRRVGPLSPRVNTEEGDDYVPMRRSKINSLIVKPNENDWRAHRNAISEYDEESETVRRISLLMAPEKAERSESQRITNSRQVLSDRRPTQGEVEPMTATQSTPLGPIDEVDSIARFEALESRLADLEKSNDELKTLVTSFSNERQLQLKTIERLLTENENIRERMKALELENAALKHQNVPVSIPTTAYTIEELKGENSKLRDENSSLVRVISRLSKSRDHDEDA